MTKPFEPQRPPMPTDEEWTVWWQATRAEHLRRKAQRGQLPNEEGEAAKMFPFAKRHRFDFVLPDDGGRRNLADLGRSRDALASAQPVDEARAE